MGAFSDNFYSWLDRQHHEEKAAMDEGYKHPDGSPCRAKNIENCPFYKQDMQESEEIDNLPIPDEVSNVEKIATAEEMEVIERGGNPNEEKFTAVVPEDLETMAEGSTQSRYRNMRNNLVKHVIDTKKGDGTYPLVDVTDAKAAEELEPVYYDDGYMVSFQTTNGEGFNKSRKDLTMSDQDYDALCEDLIAEGYKPHVGVFGGIPEISFKVDSKDVAERIMNKYNQVSIWDNAAASYAASKDNDQTLSKVEKDALWGAASLENPFYDWKTNQVVKAN